MLFLVKSIIDIAICFGAFNLILLLLIFLDCTQTMNIGTCDWYGGTVDGCDLGKIFNMK